MANYSKEIVVTTDKGDSPLQVWVPVPREGRSSYSVSSRIPRLGIERLGYTEKEIEPNYVGYADHHDNAFGMYYFELSTGGTSVIQVEFNFDNQRDLLSDLSPDKGLEASALIDSSDGITELANEIEALASRNKTSYPEAVAQYLARILKYNGEPKTRIASEVLEGKQSDCGGYHALFCSLVREKGIPAILAFGFRADVSDNYHTTAFWHDGETWIRVDVNDIQDHNGVLQPFLPMSIGTGISLSSEGIPEFPREVSFIQHSLLWVEGEAPLSVENRLLYLGE